MRKVYIVRGSEDGIIGVHTVARNAVKKAMAYVSCGVGKVCTSTQTKLMSELSESWWCQVDNGSDFATCEVEAFNLEK